MTWSNFHVSSAGEGRSIYGGTYFSFILFYSSCRVSEVMPLYDILNEFQKGHSHIAVVYNDTNGNKDSEQFKDSCKKPREQPEKSSEKGEDICRNKDSAQFFCHSFLIVNIIWFWLVVGGF